MVWQQVLDHLDVGVRHHLLPARHVAREAEPLGELVPRISSRPATVTSRGAIEGGPVMWPSVISACAWARPMNA